MRQGEYPLLTPPVGIKGGTGAEGEIRRKVKRVGDEVEGWLHAGGSGLHDYLTNLNSEVVLSG